MSNGSTNCTLSSVLALSTQGVCCLHGASVPHPIIVFAVYRIDISYIGGAQLGQARILNLLHTQMAYKVKANVNCQQKLLTSYFFVFLCGRTDLQTEAHRPTNTRADPVKTIPFLHSTAVAQVIIMRKQLIKHCGSKWLQLVHSTSASIFCQPSL